MAALAIGLPAALLAPAPAFAGPGVVAAASTCTVGAGFGRMFPDAPAATWSRSAVDALATAEIAQPEAVLTPEGEIDDEENPAIPAGETYVGQFIDHDLTLNPEAGNLAGSLDPATLVNQRTPRFDLDSVYGSGPEASPQLFAADRMHLLLGAPLTGGSDTGAVDNLRDANGQAVIGDGRNDENRLVASLHTLVMRFHNQEVDRIRQADPGLSDSEVFGRARQQTQWHYQWAVLTDFLPQMVGQATVAAVLPSLDVAEQAPLLQYYHPCGSTGMPVEFSAAVYRFGHSMVRPVYRINPTVDRLPVFTADQEPGHSLVGFGPSPENFAVDWSSLLPIDGPTSVGHPQASYQFDTSLVSALGLLPLPESGDGVNNLASRNLLRAEQLGLPSGQDVARSLGITPLRDDQVLIGKATGDPEDTRSIAAISPEFAGKAPLWTYVLAEAIAQAYPVGDGVITGPSSTAMRLGPVGGRIVAEVIVGLLAADASSVLHQPGFRPDPAVAAIATAAGPAGAPAGGFDFGRLIAAVDGTDLALVRPSRVSPRPAGEAVPLDGSAGVDGSPATTVGVPADGSFAVDLGDQTHLQRVTATWSGTVPREVTIEASTGNGSWRTLWNGPGQQVNLAVGDLGVARSVRVNVAGPGTLAEFQVFRKQSPS